MNNFIRKLTPYNVVKGFRYLKHFGIKEFLVRLSERLEPEEVPYGPWYEAYKPKPEELQQQRKKAKSFQKNIKISIVVPAYHTPKAFLVEMIESVLAQTYENWELCIANASPQDKEMEEVLHSYAQQYSNIVYKNLSHNVGIAENTNEALSLATGDFIGLLDHDDLLAPNALYEVAKAFEENSDAYVFYTDEDKVTTDLREHFQPNLKPDFNLDLLRSNNYICHFFLVHKTIVEKVGGFLGTFNGAQDYDFIFRCTTACREENKVIYHIPEILYHWRVHKASTADNPASKMYAFEAGKRAIEENLKAYHTLGQVEPLKDLGFYQVTYPVVGEPLVSIIIPNKDHKDTLKTCIDSILAHTKYSNYEILIVENNSTTQEIHSYYEELKKNENIKIFTYKGTFNYSAINNFAVSKAQGEYLLFLNNDVKIIEDSWFPQLLGNCQRKEVGTVGAKLLYQDDTIQHAGTVIGMGGIAGHMFVNMPKNRSGYMHKASLQMNYSAVTAACMMMKKSVFLQVEGFEEKLSVAFNDVDLCLKVNEAGFLVVYNPRVVLYHFESKSRGLEDNKEKIKRFQDEIEYMRNKYKALLVKGDPYYNKNLSLSKWNYSLKGKQK